MIKYEVEISSFARQEIKNIALYIRDVLKNIFAANKFLTEIYELIQDLSFMPNRYPILNELKDIRKITYSNYVVTFKILKAKIVILRVFHSSTNYMN